MPDELDRSVSLILAARIAEAKCPKCGEIWLECPCDEECLKCGLAGDACVCGCDWYDDGPRPGEP